MVKILKASELDFEISKLSLEKLVTFDESSDISMAVKVMIEQNIGSVGVTREDKLIGIVTEKDFLSKLDKIYGFFENEGPISIENVMTENPVIIKSESSFLKAIHLMSSRDFRHLPIINEKNEYAMLSVRDVLDNICDTFADELASYPFIKDWDRTSSSLQEDDILEDSVEENAISEAIFRTPLKRIYKNQINICDINSNIRDYLSLMLDSKFYITFIMEYETLFRGIITERDVLKKVFSRELSLDDSVARLMTPNADILSIHHQFGNAIKNMQKFNYRNMPVVNQEAIPIGNISLLDLLSLFSSSIADK